jgi:hypothetical protein
MRSSHSLDQVDAAFDGTQLVADAGLLLPATLAQHLGLKGLVDRLLDLGSAVGAANAGDKILTLVLSALAGGDCIDDADALRAGGTSRVLGFAVKAPSTLGTFLRSFSWGHVRQLDRVSRELLARAWAAGAGPGSAPFTIDLDSTICETYGLAKAGAAGFTYTGVRGYHPLLAVAAGTGDVLMARLRGGNATSGRSAGHFLCETVTRVRGAGATGELTVRADSGFYLHDVVAVARRMKVRFSITIRQQKGVRRLIEAIPETAWMPIPYWIDGGADVAETTYTPFRGEKDAVPVRLIVRRVKPTPGSQLAAFVLYDYHAFITDRDGEMLTLEATTGVTPRSRTRSATSSTGWGSTTCRRDDSPPTAPGSRCRSWPTTSPAGRRAWGSEPGSSRPRPSAGGCSGSSGGSPARPGGSRSTCRLAGPGLPGSWPPSRGSGRSRCSPDRSPATSRRSGGWRELARGDATEPLWGVARPDLLADHRQPDVRSIRRPVRQPFRPSSDQLGRKVGGSGLSVAEANLSASRAADAYRTLGRRV